MISRTLRERVYADGMRTTEKMRGVPASQIRMSSQRVVETLVPQINRLPCAPSDEQLQNADGSFVFLPGYSSADGPDN